MSIFNSAVSWGLINTKDMLEEFGLAVSEGADSFDRPRDPKEVYSYDWGGSAGIQYDLSSPRIDQARKFYLKGWLLGSNLNDYKLKKGLLVAELKKAGSIVIYCKKYNVTVACILSGYTNFESPIGYSFQGGAFIGVEITIEFLEVI